MPDDYSIRRNTILVKYSRFSNRVFTPQREREMPNIRNLQEQNIPCSPK